MKQIILVVAIAVLAGSGCSKSPSQTAADAATAVGETVPLPVVPKDASRQAEKIVARIAPGPECEVFREQVREAGRGSPAAATTHMAFQEAKKAAREAGCLEGP